MDTSSFPHIGDLEFSATDFPALYRRLTFLEFPLPVADILELRSVLNMAIDTHHETNRSAPRRLATLYHQEMTRLGVTQSKHVNRLACLLAVLDELHTLHRRDTRATQRHLVQAMTTNDHARKCSLRLGLVTAATLALSLALSWHVSPVSWWLRAWTAGAAYLSLDAFYSIALLRRQQRSLSDRLRRHATASVEIAQWPLLIRNLALILGYARGRDTQPAFVFEESSDVRSA